MGVGKTKLMDYITGAPICIIDLNALHTQKEKEDKGKKF